MAKQGSILIVDDNKAILSAVKLLVDKYFEKVLTLSSPNSLVSTMRTERPDVVLLDMNFNAGINTGNEGIYWLQQILDRYPSTKVVLFTAYADIDLAVKAMKMGAVDFVVKPWDNEKLIASLRNAYRLATLRPDSGKKSAGTTGNNATPMLWGTSEAMAHIRQIVDKVAVTDANILITGENGTGKDILAREIHRLSLRRNEPFVDVNVGAIPDTLFESELFGHVRGGLHRRTQRPRGQVRDRLGRHALPRRDRQPAATPSGQAAHGAAEPQHHAPWEQLPACGRHTSHLGHEPQPAGHGFRGDVPSRPALPYKYDTYRVAAAAPP